MAIVALTAGASVWAGPAAGASPLAIPDAARVAPASDRGDTPGSAPSGAPAGSPAPPDTAVTGPIGTVAGWFRLPESARARYAQDIRDMSERYGVSTSLVEAVIRVESAFNHLAVSPKGARGLMQLMPQTAQALGVLDSFNPRQNIEGGVRYLRRLLDRYPGELKLALAAYNAGEGAVDAHRGIPPYPETRQYVKKVLQQTGLTAMSKQEPAPDVVAAPPQAPVPPSPPPRRLGVGPDEPLPGLPLIDEARGAGGSAASTGALSMRLSGRLGRESASDTLARMRESSRLSR
jgi:hypothetical protein